MHATDHVLAELLWPPEPVVLKRPKLKALDELQQTPVDPRQVVRRELLFPKQEEPLPELPEAPKASKWPLLSLPPAWDLPGEAMELRPDEAPL